MNYNIVGKLSHSFTPIGKTVVCILSESHLSIHTWPEYNMIYIDLASCKEISDEQIENTFEKAFEKYEIEPFEIKNVVL